jgi:hypothetical protein
MFTYLFIFITFFINFDNIIIVLNFHFINTMDDLIIIYIFIFVNPYLFIVVVIFIFKFVFMLMRITLYFIECMVITDVMRFVSKCGNVIMFMFEYICRLTQCMYSILIYVSIFYYSCTVFH